MTERETLSLTSLLQLHARIFALRDRYDIPDLKNVTAKKYSSKYAVSWEPLEFIKSIDNVYERTPSSIKHQRNAACIVMRKKLPKILDDKTVAAVYKKVLIKIPEFTKDMLRIYVTAPLYKNCNTCDSNQTFEALQIRCNGYGKRRSNL